MRVVSGMRSIPQWLVADSRRDLTSPARRNQIKRLRLTRRRLHTTHQGPITLDATFDNADDQPKSFDDQALSNVGIAKAYIDAGAVVREVPEDHASIHRVEI